MAPWPIFATIHIHHPDELATLACAEHTVRLPREREPLTNSNMLPKITD